MSAISLSRQGQRRKIPVKQIAIIRFWYECNAFSPIKATKEAFLKREWVIGSAAKEFYRNTNVEVAAVEDFIAGTSGIEAHYIFCAAAYPAGPIEEGLFNEILDHISAGLNDRKWDGIYLSLHGSAVSIEEPQADFTLLRFVRDIIGPKVPIAVSFDLHANLNPEIGELADIVCGYKTYPHVDMLETAAKALDLLGKTMANEIAPRTRIVAAGFAPSSFNMSTAQEPMADMMARAKQLAREKGYYDVSVLGGFIYADTVDTGASITICADTNAMPDALKLAGIFRSKATQLDSKLPPAAIQLSKINHLLNQGALDHPIAIMEPSDNIFSGGAADTPGLLKAALESDISHPSLFAFFWDPGIVQAAIGAGIGGNMICKIGGRLTSVFGSSVEVSAKIENLTDGKFTNLGPMEKNLRVDLGPTAVLKIRNLSVIVTSENIPVNDTAYFNLHGLKLDDYCVVYIKAKNHFRSAFEHRFSQIVAVETPGPAATDLSSFDFRNVRANHINTQISILKAGINDAEAIAAIHTASWRDVYWNILPEAYLTKQIEQERGQFWRHKIQHKSDNEIVLIINCGEAIVGFIWTTEVGEPGYDAVIEALHIDTGYKGCGYGKKLIKAAVKQLIDEGHQSVCLRVFDDNLPAIKFYQHIGGIKDQSGIDNFAGANATDSRIGWKDIKALLSALK